MAILKFDYPEELYRQLLNGHIEIVDFFKDVLFGNFVDQHAFDELKNVLRSYHLGGGDFPEVTDLKIVSASADVEMRNGRVIFEYLLSYINTCSGNTTDIKKKDSANYHIDDTAGSIVFSFIDTTSPTPDGEF